ncbi:MAG: DinB family protein [Puniceicoccaceae bacterium]
MSRSNPMTAPAAATPAAGNADIHAALAATLRQSLDFLDGLDEATYNRGVPEAFDSTIGGHYRHVLEHFEPLVEAGSGEIDYDARKRDHGVETSVALAFRRTEALLERALAMDPAALSRPLRVSYRVSCEAGGEASADSTLGREVMFGISHAIHHFALISVMAKLLGIALPEGFGMAPSTARHRQRS